VTCYTQPCKPCKVTCLLHYPPQGDESSPRGRWGICALALPEVLTIKWGGTEIPFKTRTTLNYNKILHVLFNAENEPDILQEAEKRQNRILEADYRKVEVDPYVQELAHLTKDENKYWSRYSRNYQHCLELDLEC
jgi:hypothetical protein